MKRIQYSQNVPPDAVLSLIPLLLLLLLNNPNPYAPTLERMSYVEAGLQRCIISSFTSIATENLDRDAGWPGQRGQGATALLVGICCLFGNAAPTPCAWRLTQVTPPSWRLWCCLLTHSAVECILTDTSYLPSLSPTILVYLLEDECLLALLWNLLSLT